jgi:hypothetical protein
MVVEVRDVSKQQYRLLDGGLSATKDVLRCRENRELNWLVSLAALVGRSWGSVGTIFGGSPLALLVPV